MSLTEDHIRKLSRDFYPDGRAFKMPIAGVLDRLHKALAERQGQSYDDAFSILDSLFADNPNFTADDAAIWEARLGLISDALTPLPDRMDAINQKLNYPGTNAPRQHYLYIQNELQAAGFTGVHIYENNFSGVTKTPEQIIGTTPGASFHRPALQHKSTVRHGALYRNKIANYIEESLDAGFVIGSNYRSTFFVAGATVSTFVNVPLIRKDEFRQLILKLKPAQTVGFLFVNYV